MELTAARLRTKDLAYIGVFTALMAVCSWISIPTTVPFTLQTMGVFLAAGILGGKRGTLSVLAFILLGAVGAPVFAGFTGGPSVLLGTTGGYIIGFLFAALLMWAMERLLGTGLWVLGVSMVLGMLVYFAFGSVWFLWVYTRTTGAVTLAAVLGWCVVPFVVPDLVKIALALTLTSQLRRHVK